MRQSAQPGDRVLAIRDSTDREVFIYGAGIYVGDERPPNGTPCVFGPVDESFPEDFANPRIDLDNGSTVWGCQCWWGPEDRMRDRFREYRMVEVPVPNAAVATDGANKPEGPSGSFSP